MKFQSLSLFLLLGLLLSLLGFLLMFRSEPIPSSGNEIARLEIVAGEFNLFRNQTKKSLARQKKGEVISLLALDRLESSPGAQGLLKTSTGDIFGLLGSQSLTLDKQEDEIRIIIHQGELLLEEKSEENQTFIVWNGEKLSLDKYFLKDIKSTVTLPVGSSAEPQELNASSQRAVEAASSFSISKDQLRDFIQKNRQQFFKCYSSLLQKEPQAHGEVRVTLKIQKNGKVTQPSLFQSFTEDREFKNCLVQVLSRTEIPAFDGEPITTIVPLVFE